jgi:excisionase family DNA binding protein
MSSTRKSRLSPQSQLITTQIEDNAATCETSVQASDLLRLYSVEDVCERLTISRPTFYALVRSGTLRTVSIGTRRLVRARDLASFLDELGSE